MPKCRRSGSLNDASLTVYWILLVSKTAKYSFFARRMMQKWHDGLTFRTRASKLARTAGGGCPPRRSKASDRVPDAHGLCTGVRECGTLITRQFWDGRGCRRRGYRLQSNRVDPRTLLPRGPGR